MAKMSSAFLFFGLLLSGVGLQSARADTQYELRVDGLACPYCAYGIEKKLKAVSGIIDESLQVKLNDGIVKFDMLDPSKITEPELKQLINDSGFTLRGVTVQNINTEERDGEY